MLKTKTYDHIIKRINKCTGLSNDDCCVKQTKNKNSPLPSIPALKKKKNRTQKNKTKNKKETSMPILCTNMNKVIFIYQRVLNVVQNSGYSYFLKSEGVYNVIDYIFRKMFTGVPLRHWKQKTVCKSNHCYSLSFFDIFMFKVQFSCNISYSWQVP